MTSHHSETPVASTHRLIDNLLNAREVLAALLVTLHETRNAFVNTADAEALRKLEASVIQLGTLAQELERELNYTEFLLANTLSQRTRALVPVT